MLEHVFIGEVPTLCRNMTLGIAEVRFDPLAADPPQSGLKETTSAGRGGLLRWPVREM